MADIFNYSGEINPNDVKAHDVTTFGVSFGGILKRWTGSAWVKAKLKVYTGGLWIAKTLNFWDGSQWKKIDTNG